MEEQRQRQEDEARKGGSGEEPVTTGTGQVADNEEAMLQQALAMSADTPLQSAASSLSTPVTIDFNSMTEEEQIAYAMQLSMQGGPEASEAMTVEESQDGAGRGEDQAGAEGQVGILSFPGSIWW